jgi:hypothetical protein
MAHGWTLTIFMKAHIVNHHPKRRNSEIRDICFF